MDWYQTAKDFAGPTATTIAAISASFITWTLSSRQVTIARQQAETALDQLRHNLFENRYGIYKTVQDQLVLLINKGNTEFSALEFAPLRIAIGEARFFYSPTFCDWLDEIWKDVNAFFFAKVGLGEKTPVDVILRLVTRLEELPERFGRELQFSQLTRPVESKRRSDEAYGWERMSKSENASTPSPPARP